MMANTRLERARLQCESLLRSSDGATNHALHREGNMLNDNYTSNVANMQYLLDGGNSSGFYRGQYDIDDNFCTKDAGSRAAHQKNVRVPKSINTPSVRDIDFTSPNRSAENVSVDSLNFGRYVDNDQTRSHRPHGETSSGQSTTRMMNLSKSVGPDHHSNKEYHGDMNETDACVAKNYEYDRKFRKVIKSQDNSGTSSTHVSNTDNTHDKDGRNIHSVSNSNDQKVEFNEVRNRFSHDSTILGEKEKESIIIALQVRHKSFSW